MEILNVAINGWKALFASNKYYSINCEVSRDCNLRCMQCANHSKFIEPIKGGCLLAPSTFSNLTPILPGFRVINFDNHGEPLLNPHLEDFIRTSKTVAPKILTSFTSNFSLMTVERAESLLQAGIDKVQVSVPGVTKETHEKIMVGSSFSRHFDNLCGFRSVLGRSNRKLNEFSACVTTMRSNIHELPSVPGFIAQFGIRRLRINSLLPFSSEMVKESLMDDIETIRQSRRIYRETIKNARKLGIDVSCVRTPESSVVCRYPANNFSVSYNGDVCPCWMLDIPGGYRCYTQGKAWEIPRIQFGNISRTSILDVWDSPAYVSFREQFLKGRVPDFCRMCPVGKNQTCG